ncbi:MAG: hypothetical protein GY854_11790 [Deltaproteobacteria bacterium]|nr:hypothetical protein [Deltaproteobacteria bacterium]
MKNSTKDTDNTCPHCGKVVDPLRAPAVSVIDGHIVHFCSSTCRENHLHRTTEPPLPDDSKKSEDTNAESPSEETSPKDKTNSTAAPTHAALIATKSRSRLLRTQLLYIIPFTLLLLTSVFVPRLLGGMLPVIIVGLGALFSLIYSAVKERRFGAARMAETGAVPVTAAVVLCCSAFGSDPRTVAVAAALLLLARELGRLLELLGRRRSGVLANLEGTAHAAIPSSWRDNSTMAARIRRVALVLEWARYPAAGLVGLGVFFAYDHSIIDAMLAGATALVAFGPRALRMVTGDAHLAAALAASEKGVPVRDAHIVDQIACARVVLYMSKESLVEKDVTVVDWKSAEGADEKKTLNALGSLEDGVEGRVASGISEFMRDSGVSAIPIAEREHKPGLGIVGDTPFGHTMCGARRLFLEAGISTALLEDEAKTIEKSGRRALFAGLDGHAVAVFGIEEKPIQGALEANQKLKHMGLEPMMLTSAEVNAAQALGSRIGIENVRFETAEEEVGIALSQISATGDNAVLIGSGAAFEENLRSAAAAIAVGTSEATQAGVDARKQDAQIVPWVFKAARRARRSTEINLVGSGVAIAIGLGISTGWFSPWVVTFAASLGFAAAALSTLNGPYPLLESLSAKTKSAVKRLKKAAARRAAHR